MNTQRFVWAVTTVLFAVAGLMLGYAAGLRYVALPDVNMIVRPMAPIVLATLSLGLGIVMARGGAMLADKFLVPGVTRMSALPAVDRVLGVFGALLGLIFGVIIASAIPGSIATSVLLPVRFCIMAIATALGMAFFGGMRAEMVRVFPLLEAEAPSQFGGSIPKFLDTNVIIDGRLADICKTGFIEGPIFVPQFVLEEVQYVADSSDSMRRARGRRGLDVLNAMREMTTLQIVGNTLVSVPVVHVLNDISPAVQKIAAVDSKLVALAKEKNGSIITNDFNLNKVAELQGVAVLNLNELAGALKPVVLPGEEMQITIVKEGKEVTQGVGYLEDGTMVVVGDGAVHIGETIRVTISTVYQTVAGKMIFAELRDKSVHAHAHAHAHASLPLPLAPAAPKIKGTGDDLFEEGNAQARERNDDLGHRSGSGMRRKSRS